MGIPRHPHANTGWRVNYLSADLPLDDLINAAWQLRPAGVVLSLSDPEVCRHARETLMTLPGRMPDGALAAISGSGVGPHETALVAAGFRLGIETTVSSA